MVTNNHALAITTGRHKKAVPSVLNPLLLLLPNQSINQSINLNSQLQFHCHFSQKENGNNFVTCFGIYNIYGGENL